MSKEMMNTREVAEYLDIHEKQVYALIKTGNMPCTRVTGKWLFPKDMIDRWIKDNLQNQVSMASHKAKGREILLAAGSNDPILDMLLSILQQRNEDTLIFSNNAGSLEGLKLLQKGITDISWCHLYDPKEDRYNLPFVESSFIAKKITVVHLFYRELGLVSAADCVVAVDSLHDIANNDLRFVNRQQGAGTRVYLDHLLNVNAIEKENIKGYDTEVFTHSEVGISIKAGDAQVGLATRAIADLFGLKFSSLKVESFDMVLPQSLFFSNTIQTFIKVLSSQAFRNTVKAVGQYDFNESGKILYASS